MGCPSLLDLGPTDTAESRVPRGDGPPSDVALSQLAGAIADRGWARWAAQLVFAVAIEGVTAWLDAEQPDPERVAGTMRHAIGGVIHAAGHMG